MLARFRHFYLRLKLWQAGSALLLALPGVSLSGATLEISVPQLIHQPVLLFLEAENSVTGNTPHPDTAQARISSIMLEFDPPLQVVPLGTTIDIVNKDQLLHNTHVFDRNRTLFNVATPTTDIAVQRKLTRPGLFGVRCDLHPSMNAWIAVVSNPYYAVIENTGVFRIKDIKPGHYEVHIQRPDRGDQIFDLELAPDEQRQIRLSP